MHSDSLSLRFTNPIPYNAFVKNDQNASNKYEILQEEIIAFQENLTDDYDVAISLASFGDKMVMLVDKIGYRNPDILMFYGNINGQKSQLIQHMAQLNFLLLAVRKEDPKARPNRIGFLWFEAL